VVTTLSVQIDDAKAEALRQMAERAGLHPEQLLQASLDDLLSRPAPDFEEAARRVLSKNRDLYRRLA